MPRRLHTGRPGSRVIPATWQQQIAPVVTNVLAGSGCVVTIRPPGAAPAWNEADKQTETVPAAAVYGPEVPPYGGTASITVVSDTDREINVADDLASTRLYEVRLPWDASTECDHVGHVIDVITDPDPDLVGKHLTVQSIERDTRRFSRILYATLID